MSAIDGDSLPLPGSALEELLEELEGLGLGGDDRLREAESLRARFGPERAREIASALALRRRARERLGERPPPYLTEKGLEQASALAVARERARRVAALAPGASILDATAGIGSDALALARVGLWLVATDLDPRHARCARENLSAAGLEARVLVADAARPAARARLVSLDPDRRAAGVRSLDPSRWSPPLETALAVAARFEGAVLKLAPALEPGPLESAARARGSARACWISRGGELAELSLWCGLLAEAVLGEREALVLDAAGRSAESLAGAPLEVEALSAAAFEPRERPGLGWLSEPDPAVIRAGLVGLLAERLGLRPLAPRSAYLVGPRPAPSALVRSWPILACERADPRRVRALLARHDVGPLVVKKRGHPLSAEELSRRFAGRGARRGLLCVARTERGHVALLLGEPERVGPGQVGPEQVGDEGFEPPTSSL